MKEMSGTPDPLKRDAQEEFLKQTRVALDMAISRFDQVACPANSMMARQRAVQSERPSTTSRIKGREEDLPAV